MEGGGTSQHPVLRGNYVNLSARLTTTVLRALSGGMRGALGSQHLGCEVVAFCVVKGLDRGWV